MENLERQLDRIFTERAATYDHLIEKISLFEENFSNTMETSGSSALKPIEISDWKENCHGISQQWKDSYARLIQFGKSIDKVKIYLLDNFVIFI